MFNLTLTSVVCGIARFSSRIFISHGARMQNDRSTESCSAAAAPVNTSY